MRAMLDGCGPAPCGAIVTAPQSVSFLSLPFPESICIEAALGYIGTRPYLVIRHRLQKPMAAAHRFRCGSGNLTRCISKGLDHSRNEHNPSACRDPAGD